MTSEKERKIFGTDGIRGRANQHPMSPEVAFRVGAALSYRARNKVPHPPRVVIGKDTRLSGYVFETAVASGVCALGGRAMLSGPLPTPAIAHLTRSMRADLGVVISASHNPFEDNGIKIFGSDGFKLPDAEEFEIEQLMEGNAIDNDRPVDEDIGRAERLDDAPGRYIAYVKSTFPSELTLEGLKIVMDAANGAAYKVGPSVFTELGATVTTIGNRPDGKNINQNVGALCPDAIVTELKRTQADIGIALDGDADRLILIDHKGNIVDGDAVMAMIATHLINKGALKNNSIVTTVMSNMGLDRAIARHGGKVFRCNVGDRYVVEMLKEKGLNFGGEQSGHLLFLDHATTGDGLIAALQVLRVCLETQKTLADLSAHLFEALPQILINVKLSKKVPLDKLPQTQKTIRHAEDTLGSEGRVLVRWSGTEAKLRVLVEGLDKQQIETLATAIAQEAEREVKATT